LSTPAAFRREVIVHELLHLKLPNHGKLSRALLRAYLETPGRTEPDTGLVNRQPEATCREGDQS
jgi:hypothetical protein